MFDSYRTTINRSPDTIRVEHHHAPTDESLRLLSEMEAKAASKVLASYVVTGNGLEGVVVETAPGFAAGPTTRRYHVLLKLNGVAHHVEYDATSAALMLSRHEATAMVARAIADAVFLEILPTIVEKGTPHGK